MLHTQLADEEEGLRGIRCCILGKEVVSDAAFSLLLICLVSHSQQLQGNPNAILIGEIGKGIIFIIGRWWLNLGPGFLLGGLLHLNVMIV